MALRPIQLSGSITPTHTTVTIGATSTSVLAAKTDRKYAMFINDSDESIYLNLTGPAVVSGGIRLNAAGGSFEMSDGLGNLSTAAVKGICTSGNKKLLVVEG